MASGRHYKRPAAKRLLSKNACTIITIVMGLVAAALLCALIMVNTLPQDLTIAIVVIMLVLLLLTNLLIRSPKQWKNITGLVVAFLFVGVFGLSAYYMGSTFVMLRTISDGSAIQNAEAHTSTINPTEEPFNIYITGIDQWAHEKGLDLERSDVNMIVTVNPVTKKILLTSIPRDSYIKLHTAQQMDKLTHTGVYGVDETLNTVEDWMGIDLNYYVKMNFTGARDVINAMGGIDVYSPVAFESSLKGYKYEKGWNHLNGKRALYFARERHAFEGQDSVRVENQQRVMKAMIKKMTSSMTLLTRYDAIMNAAGNNLHTDMSYEDIRSIIRMQMTDLSSWDVETQKLEGEYDMDYVASLSQKNKYSVYRVNDVSLRNCIDAIHKVQNPSAGEVEKAIEERNKSFFANAVKRLLHKEEAEEDVEPIV